VTDSAFADLVRRLPRSPRASVLLSGAGISADAPSAIPSGLALTRRALAHGFDTSPEHRELMSTLPQLYELAGIPASLPRLETVLGAVDAAAGAPGLRYLLADLLTIAPNDHHLVAARHLHAGGRHVTANIDRGIELCLSEMSPTPEQQSHLARWPVLHFHSSADSGSDLADLGITLGRIEDGFTKQMTDDLTAYLTDESIELIVVVGYSGSDFFDMSPFLAGLEPGHRLHGKDVVWLDYADGTPRLETGDVLALSAQGTVQLMRRAGATVSVVRGSPRLAVAALCDHWEIAADELRRPPAPATEHWPIGPDPLTPRLRHQATYNLYGSLGLTGRLRSYARTTMRDRLGAADREALAMAHWDAGAYRAAWRVWRRRPVSTPAGRLLRDERRAARLWVSGRHVRAAHVVDRLLRELDTQLDDVSEDWHELDLDLITAHIAVTDTAARLWDHMRRLPDARWWASEERRRRLLAALPTPDQIGQARTHHVIGPDLEARIGVARWKLDPSTTPALAAAHDQGASLMHGETSHLTRSLNYGQGVLRTRAESGERSATLAADLRRQWLAWTEIEARGNRVRLLTIPGAVPALGWRRTAAPWDPRLDYSVYHRLRLTALVVGRALGRR
jgi:hypothetical protein